MAEAAAQLHKALEHRGEATKIMRDELATAVTGLFNVPFEEPQPLNNAEYLRLRAVVGLAIHLRAHVGRDRYLREIEAVHAAEGPGRLGMCLERLFAGLCCIGLPRSEALRVIEDVALASAPPMRRHAFEMLKTETQTTRAIAKAMKLPTNTVRRVLEDPAVHDLAQRHRQTNDYGEEMQGGADLWTVDPQWAGWRDAWAATVA
jgi:hypothetical protein